MTGGINIYFAGPLFSIAEREFNLRLAKFLKAELGGVINLPQQFSANIFGQPDFIERAFKYSLESIDKCDAVIAILDGPDVDAGTCVEIGYAFAKKKPIIGLRTDFRASEDRGMNLMVSMSCTHLIWSENIKARQTEVFRTVVDTARSLT